MKRVLGRGVEWRAVTEGATERRFISRGSSTSGSTPALLPFIKDSTGVVTHWTAVVITLDLTTTPVYLTHASLQIYKGNATDEEKSLLIRAEWDPTQDPQVAHAQPHWHIHNLRYPTNRSLSLDDELINPLAAVDRENDWPYYHIHFPMAARFHEGVDRCIALPEPATEDMLVRWAERTIKYLLAEMKDLWKAATPAIP